MREYAGASRYDRRQVADSGYFPRGESVLRQVHEERIVGVLYGQRALLLQAMHPVAFEGLLADTKGLDAPFERLVRTAKTMERIFFGSREQADNVAAAVRRMHGRVPAAGMQEHLLWILACLADSGLAIHQRFVGRLGRADRERFWQDYLTLGELFGVDRAAAPADHAAFRAYMRERVASDEMHVTPRARQIATMVAFDLPVPPQRRPVLAVLNHAIVGTLPARAREEYGLPWGQADAMRLAAFTTAVRAGAIVLPRRLWTGSSARDYEVVRRGEQRRLAAGWIPPVAA
ncbi:MAG: hypothetical protein JWM71_1239 [Solirubrobacteraceae bacterium]|nr:hypothetical protein [Solirubrobacteraceae bacterium]